MMHTIDYSRPLSNPPHLQHPFPSIFTGVNVPNSISRKSVVPSAGPKSSNVNLKIDASRRNVPWHMLPLKRLGRWWVGWEALFGCFFLGGWGGLQWWEWCWCLLMEFRFRNKLITRKVFQEIEVEEVDGIVFRLVGGFWFRSVELNSFEFVDG